LREDPESRIYDEVEVEASFQGGEEGWRSYLMKNLNANTPVENGAPAGRYTVMVQFIVAKNGAVSAVKSINKKWLWHGS
jgi:protein TonB